MSDATRRVIVGVTGGIAAYKVPALVRLLRKNGCEVKTVLTNAAKPLVGAEPLRVLSGNPVYSDDKSAHYDMDHIRLSEWADLLLICPATANTIAKMAGGIADNLLTTLTLSIHESKIIVVPAMNCVMWANNATQSNVGTLASRGVTVLPVGEGELACGVRGPGRMAGTEEIVKRVMDRFNASENPANAALKGKNVLISSGPTEEPIDPVRVITNRSSGKMGAALAKAALSMGARVTVVSGPASEPPPSGANVIRVRTAAEMAAEMGGRFAEADICVMAAAVSDYRPVVSSNIKIHRSEKENITLELAPNPDILAALGAVKTSKQFLIGFSLESGDGVDRADEKMRKKGCDMMVFNTADTALGGNDIAMTLLLTDGGREAFPSMDKTAAAGVILGKAAERIGKGIQKSV
ncbi:MAG: bifunctional phosphopantothenoylcysteine decarboxylase/phosphopantothenate--cysteine ligase CoaBC [Chitinispirillales bacterium]|jgi:phosphopantothenoylcysteine decarboxylase/phosphopantothenate--cysteine ligase|nr:bifunctional phosphopantothenoylcysteine decarboxylase/phosphopantothenate--cysteine ligase CoaBC [Chitinispirillales bacterium]